LVLALARVPALVMELVLAWEPVLVLARVPVLVREPVLVSFLL
jgi:hypothetical protein